ncbi:MAG: hypothetical protein K2G85_10955 [Muribaculaceae bacterium]|nr:hypothetical protein [Muribaculaceae bacterium]
MNIESNSIYANEGLLSSDESLAPLPHYHKRAFAHNYYAPFIYHIIIKKNERFEEFGKVKGNSRIPYGTHGCAYIEESGIGRIIAKEIISIQKRFPILQVYQFKVMPDHVHILLRVKEWSEYHLDFYMKVLVNNIADSYSKAGGIHVSAEMIFQRGYCDKPLLLKRNLHALFQYIRENPHRLAVRRQYPQFFKRIRKLKIEDKEYEAYGNPFIFRNPDKEAVKVSRKDSAEEKQRKKKGWLSAVAKGTILVSPFISPLEKAIRTEAEALGAKIIFIVHEAFPEQYKPAAHDFTLSTEGRLLIISLGLPPKTELTRSICLQMNELAKTIALL